MEASPTTERLLAEIQQLRVLASCAPAMWQRMDAQRQADRLQTEVDRRVREASQEPLR